MRPTQVTFALLALCLAIPVAADDWSGVRTALLGIPGMGIAALLYTGCALPRCLPNWVEWLLILLAFPVGWFAWTTYPDAAWFLRGGKDRRYHDAYLALCVLWLLAFGVLALRFGLRVRALAQSHLNHEAGDLPCDSP